MPSAAAPTVALTLAEPGLGVDNADVRVSPGGSFLVSFGETVRVWDGTTGALVARKDERHEAAHFLDDAEILLFRRGAIVRWRFLTGDEVPVEGPSSSSPAVSGWGDTLVVYDTWSSSDAPRIWRVASNQTVPLTPPAPVMGGTLTFETRTAPAVSRDGRYVAATFSEATGGSIEAMHLRVVDAITGEPLVDLAHRPDYNARPKRQYAMVRLKGARTGEWIESGDHDFFHGPQLQFDARGRLVVHQYESTHVHDPLTGRLLDRLQGAPGTLTDAPGDVIGFVHRSSGKASLKVARWEPLAVERTLALPDGTDAVRAALGQGILAVASNHLTLFRFPSLEVVPLGTGHDDPVRDGEFSADGRFLVTADESKAIVWDARTGAQRATVPAVYLASISPDSTSLAVRTRDGIAIYDLGDLGAPPRLAGATTLRGGASYLDWSPAGELRRVSSDDEGHVRVHEGVQPKEVHVLDGVLQPIASGRHLLACALSPDGAYLAASFPDAEGWAVWSLAEGREVFRATEGGGGVRFAPDGRWAVSNGEGTLELVSLPDGKSKKKRESLEAVAFSPDGERIAIASDDGVRIAKVGSLTTAEQYERADVVFVAFAPDGERLAVATRRGSLEIWELPKTRGRKKRS